MSNKMVLVEYTENHEANAGLVDEDDKAFTIEEGTRRYVDAASAKSLVKKKKARIVTEDEESEDKPVEKVAPAKALPPKPEGAN